MAASDEVFAVPELHEMILLHLPLISLLCSQRVCRSWQAAVTSSIAIRRALFLEPSAPSLVSLDDGVDEEHWQNSEGKLLHQAPIFNPFLNDVRAQEDCSGNGYLSLKHIGLVLPLDPEYPRLDERVPAFNRPGASWKKMVVMQPAAEAMMYLCVEEEGVKKRIEFQDRTGVKMGLVVKKLQHHWLDCPDCAVWMDETFRWYFSGDEGNALRSVKQADVMTGWEMLTELEAYK